MADEPIVINSALNEYEHGTILYAADLNKIIRVVNSLNEQVEIITEEVGKIIWNEF